MERLPIYRGTACVGTLEAECEGLYWRFSAACGAASVPLERLWVHTTGHRHCLGPLEPEHGLLVCRKRVSRAGLGGESPTHAVLLPQHQGWSAQEFVRLCGRDFEAVLRNGDELALPFDPDGPFPLPGQFCLCRVERIEGRWYAILDSRRISEP